MGFQSLLTPAIVSTILTAILAPLLFYLLKRHDEKRKRTFDIRFAEYKKYLQTLDAIAEATRLDFENNFMESISESFRNIIEGTDESNEPLLALNESMKTLTRGMRETFSKANNELHGLRLVCSENLLGLVDEFVLLQREIMDYSISIIDNLSPNNSQDPKDFLNDKMKQKADKVHYLYGAIVKQMRKELSIE